MTDESFQAGMIAVSVASGRTFTTKDLSVYLKLLKDIPDVIFLEAIENICKTHKEFYPHTNIVALIREKAIELSNPSPHEAWTSFLKASNGYTQDRYALSDEIKKTIDYSGVEFNMFDESSMSGATRRDCDMARDRFFKAYTSVIQEIKKYPKPFERLSGKKLEMKNVSRIKGR